MNQHFSAEMAGTLCFALAVLHSFLVKQIRGLALRFPAGGLAGKTLHILGEFELVFGIWAGVSFSCMLIYSGWADAVRYMQSCNFNEPVFVFAVLCVCATKPILDLAFRCIELCSRLIPVEKPIALFFSTLVIGSLLGSIITEPAAMTVTALLLAEHFFARKISMGFKYAILGLLFVNVSIGGTLTPYAAPPVLMVATKWGWDLRFMLTHFGWKGALACSLSTIFIAYRYRRELLGLDLLEGPAPTLKNSPLWLSGLHLLFLTGIVLAAHHMAVYMGIFLAFLGLYHFTKEKQERLKLREGAGVALFLAGLVVLGGQQQWWLEPIMAKLGEIPLYFGAIVLTAVLDNAALTYIGSQVAQLSDAAKYALLAGSVVGGGLTVLANAPNPAGAEILQSAFGEEGISPLRLFQSALLPTAIALLIFWLL